MKICKLENVNYKILKSFNIDFTNNDGGLVVLAGNNGSGKTTILEFLFNKLYFRDNSIKGTIYHENEKSEINKSTNIFVDKDDDFNMSKKIFYIKAKESSLGDLKQEIIPYIKNLIFDKELPPKEAYQALDDYLKEIFSDMELGIEFSGLDKNENLYFKNSFGEKVLIDDLSTGEKEMLSKVFYFFIRTIKDSVILIDEPELSLHPTWQSHILKVYEKLSAKYNNQIIIATHSPQIIASAPKNSLIILKKEENIVAMNYGSYGKDINSVLVDIMGVEYLRDIDIEKHIIKIKQMIYDNKFKTDQFKIDFDKLETMLENDNIELSLIKMEIKKRDAENS